ncbi:MAG: transglycosylase domain-containing protein [Acidimicrobiales bacterium]
MPQSRRRSATSSRPRRSWLWRWRRVLFLLGLGGFTALGGGLFMLAQAELPADPSLDQTTVLTDINGKRLASLDRGEDRVEVDLADVPQIVRDAVLATEDKNFYGHGGIDPVGIVRATVADLRGKPLQGGSTITQQYVKNTYVGPERTIWRKLKEASLAMKVERKLDKDEILQRYLNTVYFGRGAYGVQAASKAYFGKDIGEIGLGEAAYLAGLIRAPEVADTARNPEEAKRRRDLTLGSMRRAGFITGAQEQAAATTVLHGDAGYVLDPKSREPQVVMTEKGTLYFVEYVRQELVELYGDGITTAGGLRVKTSLDLDLQAKAYDAVYGFLDRPDDPSGALVALDEDGNVRAMVGGRDYAANKVNFAVGKDGGGSGRQAGSTFKPFVLASIVQNGYSVLSKFPAPPKITLPKADSGRDYAVENYDKEGFEDPIDMVEATKLSVNTVYVGAQLALGVDKVVATARDLGVTTELPAVASLTLGTTDVSPLEMAAAYSTFANRGLRARPRAILEVTRADGTVFQAERTPKRDRVLERSEADQVNAVLERVISSGTGTGARVSGTDIAGKTGTTENYGDAWFIGYTPKLTAAVWMGFPEGSARRMTSVRGQKVSGGSFPAHIFKRFMSAAVKDEQWRGNFNGVSRFTGRQLKPSSKTVIETTTTTSTTEQPSESTTTTTDKPAPTTTPTTAKPTPTTAPPATTSTTKPPGSTTTAPTTIPDGGG